MSNCKIGDLFTTKAKQQVYRISGTTRDYPIIQPIVNGKVKRKQEFEEEIFSYLKTHKEDHDIKTLFPLDNMCVDGALLLGSGEAIVLEIKHSLGWLRVCNARIQVQTMRKDPKMWKYYVEHVSEDVDGALIIFKEFSADWKDKWSKGRSTFQKGWHHFYAEEAIIGDLEVPFRIAQYNGKELNFGILSENNIVKMCL
jgi:hypothetical protein